MKIIFTICSNNYLAQAKTLGDSVLKHNPDYSFMIFLCDKKCQEVDYSFFEPHKVVEVQDVLMEKFDEMAGKYDIIELNTSVKAFVFHYIYNTFKDVEFVMYFDPDTCVFDKLILIEKELENASVLLTPHIYTPVEFDGKQPTENIFTQYGIYNLGFLATRRKEGTFDLLEWWKKRLEINCYNKPQEGIFVDQLPMNFAPIFFKGVKVSENRGLNMAPWNLHERNLTLSGGKYFVNDATPLVFYHFSNCKPHDSENLSTYYTRVTFEGQDVLRKIYDQYKKAVLKNNYKKLSQIACAFKPKALKKEGESTISNVLKYGKKLSFYFQERLLAKN